MDEQFALAKNFSPGPKWMPRVIVEVLRPLSYQLKLNDGQIITYYIVLVLIIMMNQVDDEILSEPIHKRAHHTRLHLQYQCTENHQLVMQNFTDKNTTSNTILPQTEQHHYPKHQNRRKPTGCTTRLRAGSIKTELILDSVLL